MGSLSASAVASTLVLAVALGPLAVACGGETNPSIAAGGDSGQTAPMPMPASPCPNGQTLQNGVCAAAPVACPLGQSLVNGSCAAAVAAAASPPGAPAAGQAVPGCSFDTHTSFPFHGRPIESITRGGRLFNFEADGTPWATNGMDLAQVAYFAAGPCAGAAPGQCKLETRAFALFPGNHLVEFVTARGRSWAWENGIPTDPGSDLATTQRYAEICQLRGAGPCTFDTRTFVNVNDQLTESITAYGRYFAFDRQGNRSKDSGVDLALVPRYASGPCQGQTAGQCALTTRTYALSGERTVEVVTANGRVWRYLSGEQSGFAEVQPSGVPSLSITTWAAACR